MLKKGLEDVLSTFRDLLDKDLLESEETEDVLPAPSTRRVSVAEHIFEGIFSSFSMLLQVKLSPISSYYYQPIIFLPLFEHI